MSTSNVFTVLRLEAAKRMGGRLNLGIRPYDSQEGHAAWCSDIKDEMGSPIWLLLNNGDVLWWRTGELTVEDLIAAIEARLA